MKPWERHLLERFVCPRCGAKNTPTIAVIHLGRTGDARCAHCGKEGAGKEFLPDEDRDT
jgi:transcription elongation factor Elf1